MSLTTYVAETRAAAANIEHEWDRRALEWPLTPESVVVEVGGFKGRWALQIAERYNPHLYVFEPQPWAADVCREVLRPYRNAQVFAYGLGTHSAVLAMGNWETDGCSFIAESDGHKSAWMREAVAGLAELELFHIDLMLMNIEGYEYILLPYLLDQGIVPQRLMVQWHTHATTAQARDTLLARMDEDYRRLWDYGPMLMAWEAL